MIAVWFNLAALAGYLPLLLLTIVLELAVVSLLAPRGARWRFVATGLFLNLLTHPLGYLALLWARGGWMAIELLIALGEAVGYRGVARASWPRAVLLAVSSNLVTATVALFLY